jgi:hypothetical protein
MSAAPVAAQEYSPPSTMEAMINTDEDLSPQRLGHLAIELLVRADIVRCGSISSTVG